MSAPLALAVILGVMLTGAGDHGKQRPGTCCSGCAGGPNALYAQIGILKNSPRANSREDAAEALRKFDWRRHPEAVFALRDALLFDPKDDVREQAAESLGKMSPGVPMIHEALSQAASSDPEEDVRDEARGALRSIGHRCLVECRACGSNSLGMADPSSRPIPPEWLPILAPGRTVLPLSSPRGGPDPDLDPGPALDPVRPSPLPPAIPDPDVPPPPPVPYVPGSAVGSRPVRSPR